ncbi:hypothetical protein [Nonomuraea typhae]|uniref:Uncharacterized protein n=1 Tax=Nonomuraea typhae TaxID=2603600 RepID=A0ABW7YKS7_9ACTN
MADKTTTTFPTMGMEAATTWENISSRASTSLRTPRRGYSMVEAATAGSRRQVYERLGHKGAITAQMVHQNAPEAGATLRNTYTVPKAGSQFWAKRKYGQRQQ